MRYLCSIFLLLLLLPATAGAESVPERPTAYVSDLAGIVDSGTERRLNGYLRELEQKTSAQVAVLTVRNLGGLSVEDFSLQVAERWKLGQKGKDNGLLLVVALEDRAYRFEVGYGLEGILPDSLVGSIGRQYLVPYFRRGDYSGGVAAATLAVAGVIAADNGVTITGMPQVTQPAERYGSPQPAGKPGVLGTVFTILAFLVIIYLFIRHPRLMLLMLLFSGGRRSSWGGGGGFGGGGFGGFGGGGGGGFGGGGASGSW